MQNLFGKKKRGSVREENVDESEKDVGELFEHKKKSNPAKKKIKSSKIKKEGVKKKCVVVPDLMMQENAHNYKGYHFKQPTPKATKLSTVDQLLNTDQGKQKSPGVNVQFLVCTVQCALYTVQCALCSVHCTLCSVHCTLCSGHLIHRSVL